MLGRADEQMCELVRNGPADQNAWIEVRRRRHGLDAVRENRREAAAPLHRRRRDTLAAALGRHGGSGHLQWTEPDGGLYLWCRLPPRVNSATVMTRALADSVSVVHGQPFYADHAGETCIKLSPETSPTTRPKATQILE
jgi:DNA-binding transcriptional MocR family regulator